MGASLTRLTAQVTLAGLYLTPCGAAMATCVLQPNGSMVVCTPAPPNPFLNSIAAVSSGAGTVILPSTGAQVVIQKNAAIVTTGAAVQVQNQSAVTNAGSITTTFINAYGMWAGDPGNSTSTTAGFGNTLENDGSISTSGSNAVGLFARTYNRTQGNVLINRGTISTLGGISGVSTRSSSAGIRSESAAPSSVLNEGTVAAHGAYSTIGTSEVIAIGGNGVEMAGPGTFTNAPGASVTSDHAYGFYANGTNANGITVINAGTIGGDRGAIVFSPGRSNNTVILRPGSTIIGSVDGGVGGTNQSLIFDGLISPAFANAIPNWQTVTVSHGAAVGFTAPGYVLSNLAVTAGAATTFFSPQVSISGGVINDGAVRFSSPGDINITASIQGSGSLTQSGGGTLTLSGAGTYNGDTLIDSGTLRAGAAGVLSSVSAFSVQAGAVLDTHSGNQTIGALSGAGNVTLGTSTLATGGMNTSTVFSGVIEGTGGLRKLGTGVLTLTGTNLYTGSTVIDAGTLQLGDGGTSGTVRGPIAANGGLVLQRADAMTLANAISGAGTLTQAGTGTTTVTGNNTYTGGTFLHRGVLAVHADSALGAPAGSVTFGGGTLALQEAFDSSRRLVFDVNGTIEVADHNAFSGPVTGAGGLIKTGAGTLIVNSAADYAGPTRVASGTLALGDGLHPDAALVGHGEVVVDAASALGGYGRVAGDIQNAGLIGVGSALPALAHGPIGTFTLRGTLTNGGVISMVNGAAGDQLTVDGAYRGQGGRLDVEATLNQGGTSSMADRLQAASISPTAFPTSIIVHPVGGAGMATVGDGIPLVRVLDASASAPGAFVLAGRVMAGPYEYLLFHGGAINPADGQWYLRSSSGPVPAAPVTPVIPGASPPPPSEAPPASTAISPSETPPIPALTQPVTGQPIFRPDVGAYLSNRDLASGMLLQTLHSRQGDAELAADTTGTNRNMSDLWVRITGGSERMEVASGLIQTRANSRLLQVGGQFGAWDLLTDGGRLHIGGMLSRGSASADSTAAFNPFRAQGHVDGTIGGIYATWFANETPRQGLYADAWVQYGHFTNEVHTPLEPPMGYEARAWTASLEYGYGFPLGSTWLVEPAAQVIYTHYAADHLTDVTHTRIRSIDQGNITERAAVRIYPMASSHASVRPFAEVSYWHEEGSRAMAFNGLAISAGTPKARYELAAGFQARIATSWILWARIANSRDSGPYRLADGQLGVRYTW